jgi:hypothetical protein
MEEWEDKLKMEEEVEVEVNGERNSNPPKAKLGSSSAIA